MRRMRAEDLVAAQALTQREGWPHSLRDWQFNFDLGEGWVVCNSSAKLLGTALWWPYGEAFGCVGFVVVDSGCRGQGIGRKLMEAVLEDAGDRALQLVATQAGIKLYRDCGFQTVGTIEQRQSDISAVKPIPPVAGTVLRNVNANDSAALSRFDYTAFGADRSGLLAQLFSVGDGLVAETEGNITGFALIRRAGKGLVIGPVAAVDQASAIALISAQLAEHSGFIRIDIPASATALAAWLDSIKLHCVDQATVMVRGEQPNKSTAMKIYSLISQALG